jgi:hypothetical protein
MHQSGRPVWGWRETLALPRPQKIIRPAHTPLKSDFYNKIGHKRTHPLQQKGLLPFTLYFCWIMIGCFPRATLRLPRMIPTAFNPTV